jgi:subfamily B ATP-binding cassette protein MsbA
LIIRLYDPTYGSFEIDVINLKDLDIQSWRKKIGFVSQDVFIFNISARENICYGHFEATDEEIISAAKKAEIHDFIMKLPDGYNTIMGERGVKLSGGQRQRISIARAIIHNPEILILDEATSSLDTKTEKLIQREFGNLMKNRTVIMISHRLSTVINADNIVVIDKGRIVEQSDHLNLLKKEGVYSEIYNIQVKDKG